MGLRDAMPIKGHQKIENFYKTQPEVGGNSSKTLKMLGRFLMKQINISVFGDGSFYVRLATRAP